MKNLIFFLLLLTSNLLSAQQYTISGFLGDAKSGEKLIGATVLENNLGKGTSTNVYGFYSLTLPKGKVQLTFSFVGYESISKEIELDQNIKLDLELAESIELDEVTIVAIASEKIQEKTQMSTIDISMEKVKSLPVLLGEKDVLKTIQLLPGVQAGSEGSSGLYVRGGGPDQNLILLDGVPVYNASHLFGFFSVFNADAINSVQLIKGGFPARYGGRLSSVIDIRMKEGNMKEFHGEGSIGIISSKLTLEGPIQKDKTSFIVSARRTYLDLLAKPIINSTMRADGVEGTMGYFFYDLNGKVNHKFSNKSRLYLSTYLGDDKFYFREKYSYIDNGYTESNKSEARLRWGNIISALRWNYILTDKLFSNFTLRYSKYRFNVGAEDEYRTQGPGVNEYEKLTFDYISGIRDWSLAADFDFMPTPDHYIKFGAGDILHKFTPGVNQIKYAAEAENLDTTFGSKVQQANEFYAYIEDDYRLNETIKLNGGVHFSGFLVNGRSYFSIQPRISGRYLLDENTSIKASYARMTQYLHLLTNTSIGLPTDLWVPATDKVMPQNSDQIAAGYAKTFNKQQYEISIEGYYKWMNNLIEYRDGASFFGSEQDWQDKVETGKGSSYGLEVLLEKKQGRTTGWIGYTLSWTNRQFEYINFGEKYPYRYDRRHDIGLAITHKFDDYTDSRGRKKWVDIGLVWVYGTGNAVTLGLQQYLTPGTDGNGYFNPVEHIDQRNNYRMPAYHRLDLGVNIHTQMKKHERTWSFGVYNIYSRRNPFYLYFGVDDFGYKKLKQVSLFPLIPSVSYSFKF